jgi:hypothetical protein
MVILNLFQEIIFGIFASLCYISSSSLLTIALYAILYPVLMVIPFTSLFSAIMLTYVRKIILK